MTTNLNLEIYEFILNEYSTNASTPSSRDKFYTTQIESISSDTCGYISNEDAPYTKKPIIDTKRRSCDNIDGTIKNMENTPGPKQDLKIIDSDKTMFFNLDGMTSDDLISFSYLFNTKETIKPSKTDIVAKIPSMNMLYDLTFINTTLTNCETLLKTNWPTDNRDSHTYIKILRPTVNDKFIIMGDFHGSHATFIRILLRLRKMGVFDENCNFNPNYHLIFLGDLVDRGIYGWEIAMLIYLLKLKNPNNIHINNGNHEEENTNWHPNNGFKTQIVSVFGSDDLWFKINNLFKLNHSALLIENPNLKTRYVYLAHGGFPTDSVGNIHYRFNESTIRTTDNIFIADTEITTRSNNIRWNDFYGKDMSIQNRERGGSWIIGKNQIEDMKKIGIDLTIRGHQDQKFNTKLIEDNADYKRFLNINDIDPYDVGRPNKMVCYGYTHIIKLTHDKKIQINELGPSNLLPVITISTNTDLGRDLTRDSFTILKFIEEFNSDIQGCVEENSDSESIIKANIRRGFSVPVAVSVAPIPTPIPTPIPGSSPTAKKLSLNPLSKPFVPRISSIPSLPGGWRSKYLKYKAKYMELKKNI